jgi:hypothetical protein
MAQQAKCSLTRPIGEESGLPLIPDLSRRYNELEGDTKIHRLAPITPPLFSLQASPMRSTLAGPQIG